MPITILSVGAHMDDNELGMGPILLQAVRAGHRVVTVVGVSDYYSWGETKGREEQVRKDQLAVAAKFGYEKRFLGYPYHCFPNDLGARKKIAEIYLELMPDITFTHTPHDHWPDHVNVSLATKDAVLFSHGYTADQKIQRCRRVFGYNVSPGQSNGFAPDFFVPVQDVLERYMDLIAHTDGLLSNRRAEQCITQELKNLQTNETLRLSSHGWGRLIELHRWGDMNNTGPAVGYETLWGPKNLPLW